jgi:hypothetical protein
MIGVRLGCSAMLVRSGVWLGATVGVTFGSGLPQALSQHAARIAIHDSRRRIMLPFMTPSLHSL